MEDSAMEDVAADLTAIAEDHLAKARGAAHGRSAQLIVHDGPLRQSVIALASGAALDEHNTPPAASVAVLRGRVRLTMPDGGGTELAAGQLGQIPKVRHGLVALEDAAVLLTAVTAVAEAP
ncbi:cupin [Streptomyces sp. NPDC059009]|uniref:cupin n=1 Tax=Streptomyces sp. NPDC059009 TaxID=3346694 RepID=UPI0036CDB30A